MKIKVYNQMMAYLTRPSTPLERKYQKKKLRKIKTKLVLNK